MNALIPLYVTLQTFVQDRAEQLQERRERGDRGASALEYGALIAVAAVVIAILYGAINGTFAKKVGEAVENLFKGGSS
ncbi:hypothetical protein [Spirillospora sp. CA-294931]|uniref:hypothetical protein n=1 Tax=Spirillospora sp. CA-294931 TaxID=3240042 RepID=UPI003D9236BA